MSNWDFNCPQFVDFSAEFEKNYVADNILNGGALDSQTEPKESFAKTLVFKMSTPKLRPVATLRNSPLVNASKRSVATDDEKIAVIGKPISRLPKKGGCLVKAMKNLRISEKKDWPFKNLQKKSLSDGCIRKKKKYSNTPKCFKLTVLSKLTKAKTTEELELKKIAELQNKLQQQLKLNRINLVRMKMNRAPFTYRYFSRKKICKAVPLINKSIKDLNQPLIESKNRKLQCQSEKNCDKVPNTVPIKVINDVVKINDKERKRDDTKLGSADDTNNINRLKKDCKIPLENTVSNIHGGFKFIPKQKMTFGSISQNARLCDINASTSSTMKTPIHLDNKENFEKLTKNARVPLSSNEN